MLVQIRSVSLGQVSSVCQLRSGVSGQVKFSSRPVRLVRSSQVVFFKSTQSRICQVSFGHVVQVSSGGPVWVKSTWLRGGVRRVVRMGN